MRYYVTLLSFTMLLLHGTSLIGAVPGLISYQGQLSTSSGTPVPDGSYSIVFTIYNAPSAGSPVWTETQTVTTLGGAFAVLLGTANPIADTVFSAVNRYLGVKVGADPEMTPLIRLVSMPYAFRVSTLDGATGGAVSGDIRLDGSSATTGNIYKNGERFLHTFGTDNTFLGTDAGNFAMSGSNNTGIGLSTLLSNANGSANTAVGANALYFSGSGSANTASGAYALYRNLSGGNNTAIGANALYSNEVGFSNVAAGYEALYSNLSGNSNTAIGRRALYSNVSGSNNIAIGSNALDFNLSGINNVAIGGNALLRNVTGFANTAAGTSALVSNTSGGYNTATGSGALSGNEGGSLNSAYGADALTRNISGVRNTAVGDSALYYNIVGSRNTAVGDSTLFRNTSGNKNTAIGHAAGVASSNLTNATAIGSEAIVDASNKIRLGNAAITVIEGQVPYSYTSDRNEKERFQTIDGDEVLDKIRRMSLMSWNYKGQDSQKFRHYGPVAQDFYEAFGHDGVGTCGDSTTINSGDMAGITFIAVQTLQKQNELLEAEVAKLKELVQQLVAERNPIRESK